MYVQERIRTAARVRACNSVNLKPGRIIEPLLKIVNILCMHPELGVVHSDQPTRHGYGGVRSVGAFYRIWQSQQKDFVRLKMLKILFASGIQAWKWKCPRLSSCT